MANVLYPIIVAVCACFAYLGWLRINGKNANIGKNFTPVFKMIAAFSGLITGALLIIYAALSGFGVKIFQLDESDLLSAVIIGAMAIAYYSVNEIQTLRRTIEK